MKHISIIFYCFFLLNSCHSQKNDKKTEWPPPYDYYRLQVPDSLRYLFPTLDSVHYYDQIYRRYKNIDTGLMYRKQIQDYDSANLKIIVPIIEKYGILSIKEIGIFGHLAIVMTIQHADLATQEKYLPLFREAIKNKKIMPDTYAMLEDRIAVRNGKMQIYGTQVMKYGNKKAELMPVIGIDSINQRRASIGMTETIEVYLKQFGIKWDMEKYQKDLPQLKEKYKLN